LARVRNQIGLAFGARALGILLANSGVGRMGAGMSDKLMDFEK